MIVVPTRPFLRRRSGRSDPSPAPVMLTLVSAGYDPGTSVTLTFDRAIDIAGIDVATILVDDGPHVGVRLRGVGSAVQTAPAAVRVLLEGYEEWSGPGVKLTAGDDSGIVAVDDGGTWAGVTAVAIPFS